MAASAAKEPSSKCADQLACSLSSSRRGPAPLGQARPGSRRCRRTRRAPWRASPEGARTPARHRRSPRRGPARPRPAEARPPPARAGPQGVTWTRKCWRPMRKTRRQERAGTSRRSVYARRRRARCREPSTRRSRSVSPLPRTPGRRRRARTELEPRRPGGRSRRMRRARRRRACGRRRVPMPPSPGWRRPRGPLRSSSAAARGRWVVRRSRSPSRGRRRARRATQRGRALSATAPCRAPTGRWPVRRARRSLRSRAATMR